MDWGDSTHQALAYRGVGKLDLAPLPADRVSVPVWERIGLFRHVVHSLLSGWWRRG